MPLTARSARIKAARRLTSRSHRDEAERFLVEGPQALREALRQPTLLVEVFATAEGRARHGELVDSAVAAAVPVHLVTDDAVRSLTGTVNPQGLVGVSRLLRVDLEQALAGEPRLVAVLCEARDPGNAGTVIRTADAAGADAVVLTSGSVDPHNDKCVRSSAGSIFHLPIADGVSTPEAFTAVRAKGLTVLAADAGGDWDLDRLIDLGMLAGPTAWVFGNESWGLPEATRALADQVVRVPIYGQAESLNVASAAAICLYASARAHRRAGGRSSGGSG